MDTDSSNPDEHGRALKAESSVSSIQGLDNLCQQAAPVWAGQIDAVRSITDNSIIALSQRFYGLSERIQSSTQNPSHNDGDESLVDLLQQSQLQLNVVIDLLRASIKEKKALVTAVLDLSAFAKELKEMATSVNTIARQTNMVAINAAIEAAHVGQAGRGFAVVANEVKNLSNHAATTGKQIAEKVRIVNEAITATAQISQALEENDIAMVAQAEEVVAQVVDKFGEAANRLAESEETMRAEGQHIGNEISGVLVDLQFQDRVSQMLSHVHADLNKLTQTITSGVNEVDPAKWLTELEATYTMQEQYDIHNDSLGLSRSIGKARKAKSAASLSGNSAGNTSDEITFF